MPGENRWMCNRYRPASVVRIRDVFGFTYIESGPDLRYNTDGIGPLQPGPFVVPGRVMVGQWGLIPSDSVSRKPQVKVGRPKDRTPRIFSSEVWGVR
jgi:hypothetical protein